MNASVLKRSARALRLLETLIFAHRRWLLAILAATSLLLGWQASGLKLDAAFDRAQPADHPYSQAELRHRDAIDGANPMRIALLRKAGSIYDPAFLSRLKALTDGIGHLPGIDRSRLRSLFTPEVRYVEVSEGRYFGASVVPADFDPENASRAQLATLRSHVAKAGITGRYVSADQRGAQIEIAWLARDPLSGAPYDQRQLLHSLDDVLRAARATSGNDFSIHLIGAPALAEALAVEAPRAALFAAAGLALSGLLLVIVLGSLRVTALSLGCVALATIWQLGLIRLFGIALDPDAAWAIAVTVTAGLIAGAQFGLRWLQLAAEGDRAGFEASLQTWRQLAGSLGGGLLIAALAAAMLAAFSDVPLSRQVALVVVLGLIAAVPMVGLGLPILLSWTGTVRSRWRLSSWLDALIDALAALSRPRAGIAVLVAVGALGGLSIWQQRAQPIEPAGADLARLSPDNPAKTDAAKVAAAFPRNVREFRVIVEAAAQACTDAEALEQLDRLVWQLENLPMVTGSTALPQSLKRVLTAFSEGSPKFRVLTRNRETLTQAMAPITADSGLHADDCATFPVSLYLDRRDAASLATVAAEVDRFNRDNAAEFFDSHRDVDAAYCADPRRRDTANARACPIRALLASGPLGASLARQTALLDFRGTAALIMFGALAFGVWLLLGDALAMAAVLLPLAVAGWIGLGMAASSGVALTLLTLPLGLSSLAAGVGSHLLMVRHLRDSIAAGQPLAAALREALAIHGRVLLVALAMAAGFAVWIAAAYPAQRGVGKLLALAWTTIALSGLVILPAFASLLLTRGGPDSSGHPSRPGSAPSG